jgi:hypothetical protein
MVHETDAGDNLRRRVAVQIEIHPNPGFRGIAFDAGCARHIHLLMQVIA